MPVTPQMVVFLAAATAQLGLLAWAIVLRVRVWSPRPRAVRSSVLPAGAVAVGSRYVPCPGDAVAAQLADWSIRGVVTTTAVEPSLPEDIRRGISGGPRWRFELGSVDGLSAEDRVVLTGFFPPDAAPGAVVMLDQDDQAMRENIDDAIQRAHAMHEAEGTVTSLRWPAVLIRVLAVVAMLTTLVASAMVLSAGAAAGLFFAEAAVMVATIVLCIRPRRATASERAYRDQLRGLREFVLTATADEIAPELIGWARLWDLPGPWADAAPAEVLALHGHDRAFAPVVRFDTTLLAID